jgi:hypothetical protein
MWVLSARIPADPPASCAPTAALKALRHPKSSFSIQLEFKAHSELPVTGCAALKRRCNLPESRIAPQSVRRSETRRVKEIEELTADFQCHAFLRDERFFDRDINVVDPIGSESRKIPGRISGLLIAGICKATRTESALSSESRLVGTDAAAWVANDVGSLIAIVEGWLRHADIDRLSRLESQDGRERPTSHDPVQSAIHVSPNPPSSSDR